MVHHQWWNLFLLLVILGLAAYLRLNQLETLPPPLHVDEAGSALSGLAVVNGERPLFAYGFTNHLNTAFLLPGLVLDLFGKSVWNLRIIEVVFGLVAVLFTYLLGRRLFSWRVGVVAATLLTVNHFAIAFSRLGLVNQQSMTVQVVAFWLLWEGHARRRSSLTFMGGVMVGLGLYLYFASWVVPVILALFGLWCVIFRRQAAMEQWRQALWGAAGFVLVCIPWLAFPLLDPEAFQQRPSQVFIIPSLGSYNEYWGTGNPLQVMWLQVLHNVKIFVVGGDFSNQYGHNAPLFFPVTLFFFVVGLVALARFRKPRHVFLALWLGTTLLVGGILTDSPPFMPRLVGMLPVAMLIAALGVAWSVDLMARLVHRGRLLRFTWNPPINSAAFAGALFLGTFAAVALLSLVNNHRAYFHEYPVAPHTIWWPWIEPMNSIGSYIESREDVEQVYMFSTDDGYVYLHSGHAVIRFYMYGHDARVNDVRCRQTPCVIPRPRGRTMYVLPEDTVHLLERVERLFPGGATKRFMGHQSPDGSISEHFVVYEVRESASTSR